MTPTTRHSPRRRRLSLRCSAAAASSSAAYARRSLSDAASFSSCRSSFSSSFAAPAVLTWNGSTRVSIRLADPTRRKSSYPPSSRAQRTRSTAALVHDAMSTRPGLPRSSSSRTSSRTSAPMVWVFPVPKGPWTRHTGLAGRSGSGPAAAAGAAARPSSSEEEEEEDASPYSA